MSMTTTINTAATAACADVEEAAAVSSMAANGANNSVDSNSNKNNDQPSPLLQSSRLKGYILLLVTASLNFSAAYKLLKKQKKLQEEEEENLAEINWCIVLDNLGSFLDFSVLRHVETDASIRYAMAAPLMTVIISCFIILCYFDLCTSLRRTLWPKMFGPNKKVELFMLSFLVLLWLVTIWFNTSIRGIAGEGNDTYNIYFTSWLCLWASFWTLERWFVASGMSSFEKFVRSWPHRCPMWIITFILSFADFLFVLDAFRNWDEGTKSTPFIHDLFSGISIHEWGFLLEATTSLFLCSLCWILAEIFRKNQEEKGAVKSDVENYAEGILLHLLSIQWVILIFFATMPGHSASLIGNLYFTTWGTCFSLIATLVWWLRDWRRDIADTIKEQQAEYESAKRAVLRREVKRLAKIRKENAASAAAVAEDSRNEDIIDEEDIVDDDVTVSIASVAGSRARTDTIDSSEGQRAVCTSSAS